MAKATSSAPQKTPAPGQIWEEVDSRFTRFIMITVGTRFHLYENQREIRRVEKIKGKWEFAARSRYTAANIGRFNGKRGGYRYVEG